MSAFNLSEERGCFRSACFDTFFLTGSIVAFLRGYFRKFSSFVFKKRKKVESARLRLVGTLSIRFGMPLVLF